MRTTTTRTPHTLCGTCARFFPAPHVKSPTKIGSQVRILHLTCSKSRAAQFAYCSALLCPIFFLFKKMRLGSFKLNFPDISTYEEQLSKVHLLFCVFVIGSNPMVEGNKIKFHKSVVPRATISANINKMFPLFSTKLLVNYFVPKYYCRYDMLGSTLWFNFISQSWPGANQYPSHWYHGKTKSPKIHLNRF